MSFLMKKKSYTAQWWYLNIFPLFRFVHAANFHWLFHFIYINKIRIFRGMIQKLFRKENPTMKRKQKTATKELQWWAPWASYIAFNSGLICYSRYIAEVLWVMENAYAAGILHDILNYRIAFDYHRISCCIENAIFHFIRDRLRDTQVVVLWFFQHKIICKLPSEYI